MANALNFLSFSSSYRLVLGVQNGVLVLFMFLYMGKWTNTQTKVDTIQDIKQKLVHGVHHSEQCFFILYQDKHDKWDYDIIYAN